MKKLRPSQTPIARQALSCALAFSLVLAGTPVVALADDAAAGTGTPATASAEKHQVVVSVIGPDAFGQNTVWATAALEGTTADEVTKQLLDDAGLAASYSYSEYGFYLESITSSDGRELAYDPGTGAFWQLFVDGEASLVGASSVNLADGQVITWEYSAYGAPAADDAQVVASISVIGTDADGGQSTWLPLTEVSLLAGATAADLIGQIPSVSDLGVSATMESWGYYLQSLTSPDGRTLGYDPVTNAYWQLFVNGEYSMVGASAVTLAPGDQVSLLFAADGGTLPAAGVELEPDAPRTDVGSAWSGFAGNGGGAVTEAATPTDAAEVAWTEKLKETTDWATNVSDPIIVGDGVLVAVGNELRMIDATSGGVLQRAALASDIDSIARMAYDQGVIVVPLSGGRLQALTAQGLKTLWVTDAVAEGNQSLATPLIANGYVYAASSQADWSASSAGALQSVSLANGAVRSVYKTPDGAGFYWAGAAKLGGRVLIADDAGSLISLDARDLSDARALNLGTGSRSTVVVAGDAALVVTKDGVLHKVALAADGTPTEVAQVKFANSSTSTPTVFGGKAYVGGMTADYKGLLAQVDVEDMTVVRTVSAADGSALPGDVKATPLVSAQDGRSYVYFTCNNQPGGVYVWEDGAAEATALYAPEGDLANWCMASVIAGADGALYYVNDSGNLFKLVAPSPEPEPSPEPAPGPKPSEGEKPVDPRPASGTEAQPAAGSKAPAASGQEPGSQPAAKAAGADAKPAAAEAKPTAAQGDDAAAPADGAATETAVAYGAPSADVAATPVWPYVGIAASAAALLLALIFLARRRKDEDQR